MAAASALVEPEMPEKKQHRDQDHVAEAAADMADQHARQCHQPPRDASGLHQFAGEDEERDGEQRKIVDAGKDPARHDAQRRAFDEPQAGERCRPERKRDRDACDDERERRGASAAVTPAPADVQNVHGSGERMTVYRDVKEHEAGADRQRQIGPLHAHRERHGKLPCGQIGLVDSGLEQDEEENRGDRS